MSTGGKDILRLSALPTVHMKSWLRVISPTTAGWACLIATMKVNMNTMHAYTRTRFASITWPTDGYVLLFLIIFAAYTATGISGKTIRMSLRSVMR